MKLLNLVQGTQEWKQERLINFCASEAPAMMGESKYTSRQQLLELKKGLSQKPVSKAQQIIFDKGHAAEDLARPIVELDEMESFPPAVGVLDVQGLPLLASFDGINTDHDTVWEHKLFNETLAANVRNNILEPHYYWQLEHQLLVADATTAIFTTSDGTEYNKVDCNYTSLPQRRAALIVGWKQFQKDLAAFKVKAKVEKVEGKEVDNLPALTVSLTGSVNNSNLAIYQSTAMDFISSINTNLVVDQDFADAEKAIKFCQSAEKELDEVKVKALSETQDIKVLFETINALKEAMRDKRLTLNKLVKTQKEKVKGDLIAAGVQKWATFLTESRAKITPYSLPVEQPDLGLAIKGKRSFDSMVEAIDEAVTKAIIDATVVLEVIQKNALLVSHEANGHIFLFNDMQDLIIKDTEALSAIIEQRIAKYKSDEAEKAIKAKAEAEAEVAASQNNTVITPESEVSRLMGRFSDNKTSKAAIAQNKALNTPVTCQSITVDTSQEIITSWLAQYGITTLPEAGIFELACELDKYYSGLSKSA